MSKTIRIFDINENIVFAIFFIIVVFVIILLLNYNRKKTKRNLILLIASLMAFSSILTFSILMIYSYREQERGNIYTKI